MVDCCCYCEKDEEVGLNLRQPKLITASSNQCASPFHSCPFELEHIHQGLDSTLYISYMTMYSTPMPDGHFIRESADFRCWLLLEVRG